MTCITKFFTFYWFSKINLSFEKKSNFTQYFSGKSGFRLTNPIYKNLQPNFLIRITMNGMYFFTYLYIFRFGRILGGRNVLKLDSKIR